MNRGGGATVREVEGDRLVLIGEPQHSVDDGREDVLLLDDGDHAEEHHEQRDEGHRLEEGVRDLVLLALAVQSRHKDRDPQPAEPQRQRSVSFDSRVRSALAVAFR